MTQRNRTLATTAALLALLASVASAHEGHQHGVPAGAAAVPVFVASTAKPFSALMDDAMVVMDYGMRHALMNGGQEHDFVTMMMPHHQGAVDMAKALLLTTTDPELRNLAQGMIAEQQIEIQYMQLWLEHHPTTVTTTTSKAMP